ncbi:MAG: hypothetical protein AAB758_02940 [Patescibacteria group bacterium]
MKEKNKSLEERITDQVDELANTMSRAIGTLETRFDSLEDEHKILTNHYVTLSNRVNFLEKKVLKAKK